VGELRTSQKALLYPLMYQIFVELKTKILILLFIPSWGDLSPISYPIHFHISYPYNNYHIFCRVVILLHLTTPISFCVSKKALGSAMVSMMMMMMTRLRLWLLVFGSAAATAATFNAPRCYQSGNDSCGHSPPEKPKPNIRPSVRASGTHMQHTKYKIQSV